MENLAGLALVALSLAAPPGTSLPIAGPDAAQQAERTAPRDLEVPFACGAKVVISQAHGTFSHLGTDRWAWDFRVPEGTPVLAAHDGVVRMVRSDSVRGGCDRAYGPDANYVILSRGDGFETQYLHFSKVFVGEGQRVRAGELLGEVGRTGFSCGSHLHFQLQREGRAWAGQSVVARFRDIGDPEAEQAVVSGNCPMPEPATLQAEAAPPAEGGPPRDVQRGGAGK
ncbi:MAG: M23 family metallopeptidase [Deltaproteobacteria bacterium]|nr:M23 family metallopeptidase [Deltaproteobacteria bacterium]